MVQFPGVRMLYRLPTPINNVERCLNMETLCSSTTKGTGCAAAVPEEEKKEGEKRDLSVKIATSLSLIHQQHWGTAHGWKIYKLQKTDALGQVRIPTCNNL